MKLILEKYKSYSFDQLYRAHSDGILPTGIYDWLVACKKSDILICKPSSKISMEIKPMSTIDYNFFIATSSLESNISW